VVVVAVAVDAAVGARADRITVGRRSASAPPIAMIVAIIMIMIVVTAAAAAAREFKGAGGRAGLLRRKELVSVGRGGGRGPAKGAEKRGHDEMMMANRSGGFRVLLLLPLREACVPFLG
jgi:hypothetical protein